MKSTAHTAGRMAVAAALAAALASCNGTAAALSCDQIADQARTASQAQGTPVTRFSDVQEVSATDTEKRCTAMAETAVGNTSVHLRGYQDESGNQMVAFQEAPFE